MRGEKPLWDFPDGTLAGREVAAYLVSEALGLHLVPPTVLRPTGPYGTGSVQLWIDPTEDPGSDLDAVAGAEPGAGVVDLVPLRETPEGWLTVLTAESTAGEPVALCHADSAGLRSLALFDAVTNNSDRKGGHVLRDADGRVKGVDHGLTFNVDDKLRTVLWGWAGEPLTDEERALLTCITELLAPGGALAEALAEHLTRAEVRRTRQRAERLLAVGRLPEPGAGWPPVPWPAF